MKIHLLINGRECVLTLSHLGKIGHRRGFECSSLKAVGLSHWHGIRANLNCIIAHQLALPEENSTRSSIVALLPRRRNIKHTALWTRMVLNIAFLHLEDFGEKGLVYLVDPHKNETYLAAFKWRKLNGGTVLLRSLDPKLTSDKIGVSTQWTWDQQITQLLHALRKRPKKRRTVLIDL